MAIFFQPERKLKTYMSKFCDVFVFVFSLNYKLLRNAVIRLSDIPLQAIGRAKKQNDSLVDTDATAANSNQSNHRQLFTQSRFTCTIYAGLPAKSVVLKLVGSIEPSRCHASIHRTLNYNQERIQKILEGDAVLN